MLENETRKQFKDFGSLGKENNNKNEKKNKDQSCRDVVGLRTDRKRNRRSRVDMRQMMKSAIPGCWQEKEGKEQSSLCPTADHMGKRGGSEWL